MKLLLLFGACAVMVAACSRPGAYRAGVRPPASAIDPMIDTLHGVAVSDPYRWLEGDNSDPSNPGQVTPAVAAWTDAQNQYTRDVLDRFPGRQALEDRLQPLMEVGSVSPPAVRGGRYFYSKREGNQAQPIVYWRDGVHGEARVAIDPGALDPSGLTTVEWHSASEDGRVLAYGTYRAGDENTTLHVLDVDTGERLPLEIPNRTQAAQWSRRIVRPYRSCG